MFQDFDGSFYKSLFPALAQADAGAVLEHWRTVGIAGNIPGSRAELLRQVGFTNTRWVDELFDYETYLRLNPDLGATIGNEPRAFCHFVLSGMAQGRQISESIAFDPGFYGEYYRNLIRGSVGELYHHWLNTGYASGACPSAPAFMNRVGMGNFVLPDIFTLDRYLAMNPELGHLVSRWHAFEHFIEHGFFEGRSSGLPPSEEVQVLWQIGRSFRGRGAKQRGRRRPPACHDARRQSWLGVRRNWQCPAGPATLP